MKPNEHLEKVLEAQTLDDDGDELQQLQSDRKDVEKLLRSKLDGSPSIRYGGSVAKKTLIQESYDLDLLCYFGHEDNADGDTLAELFAAVAKALSEEYAVTPKRSALRLLQKDDDDKGAYTHIDVVPGRYVDDDKEDVFLHQDEGEKDRLKTNPDVQIDHIKNSGLVPAVRLLKLWRVRRDFEVKQFVFELLVIDFLEEEKESSLSEQLVSFWKEVSETDEPPTVEDPANPSGNDLSDFLTSSIWDEIKLHAKETLALAQDDDWDTIFPLPADDEDKAALLGAAIESRRQSSTPPSRPWCAKK